MSHQVKKLTERISLLYGVPDECCIYLLEGSEGALLVDTGFGITDIYREAEALTDLPFWVVNTHGHGDHSGGDMYCDTVYMSAEAEADVLDAINLNKTKLSAETIAEMEKNLAGSAFRPSFITEGFTFDLGDVQVETIEIPGHTAGDLAFLDRQDRVLFSGDCCVKSMDILLVVPQALTLSAYLASMKKLQERRGEFDWLCTGHDEMLMPASFVDDVVGCCEKILSGEIPGEDFDLPAVFGDTKARRAAYRDFSIAYRQNRLV